RPHRAGGRRGLRAARHRLHAGAGAARVRRRRFSVPADFVSLPATGRDRPRTPAQRRLDRRLPGRVPLLLPGDPARGSVALSDPSPLSYFLTSWLDPSLLLLTGLGTLAGIYIGAIPGLSVTMAVSILI